MNELDYRVAIEALENHVAQTRPIYETSKAIDYLKKAHKEALAQPEQDTCKGCNGNGVVGNILDTDTCPCCKGSGIEAQPVAVVDANDDGYWADILPDRSVKVGQLLYTTPPQRDSSATPRTWVDMTDEEILAAPNNLIACIAYVRNKLKEKNNA